MIGKTAAYTICKNEIDYVTKWLFYTQKFDYRVILDTGSDDGPYEEFKKYDNVIIEQKIFDPWRFDVARKYNLAMVPEDVNWCLSPDLDEYFSINVLSQMEKTINLYPNVTNISCDRLDVYSENVRVGPPKTLGTNKIHRRFDYTWKSPIYEHLSWIHKDRPEAEIYNDDIYLIHDQDITKPRSKLYVKMLIDQYNAEPSDIWCLWFLVSHYYKERDFLNFIKTGCDYIRYSSDSDSKYIEIKTELTNIVFHSDANDEIKNNIRRVLKEKEPWSNV